jgi:hypothetical protein
MQSPPADTPPDGNQGKSRLDRELDEILSKNENIRLLPPPPKPARKKPTPLKTTPALSSVLPPRVRQILASPLVLALGLAVLALLVSDISPLLANLLCLAAVVCIILPMIQRFRGPSSPPETRMWRGQVMDVRPSQSGTPLDSIRNWWKSLRR